MSVHACDHPLAAHLLTILRSKTTDPHAFRAAARTLSTLLAIDATQGLATETISIETPLEPTDSRTLAQGLAVIPILRAGLSMLEPFLELFPDVAVGYVGLERDHTTAEASSYYCKLPKLQGRVAICVDPMLATGGSAAQALDLIKAQSPDRVILVSVVATPEGVARVKNSHADCDIYIAALDRGLNAQKYILPGLGDYGDRLYGTA
ncbi:uracil phosphoribosyltransferase [Kamptonema cortianum]|nr:uracil phosphoribosyltransferase [Geitlerinema splendidum]MDK3158367.1 uracil phosphoribosyltransferase [Kamptonema cortianum]